jgi:hypothetical protein
MQTHGEGRIVLDKMNGFEYEETVSICENGTRTINAKLESVDLAPPEDWWICIKWYKSGNVEIMEIRYLTHTWDKYDGKWKLVRYMGNIDDCYCKRDEQGVWHMVDYYVHSLRSGMPRGFKCRPLIPADLLRDIRYRQVKQSIEPRLTDAYTIVNAFL